MYEWRGGGVCSLCMNEWRGGGGVLYEWRGGGGGVVCVWM